MYDVSLKRKWDKQAVLDFARHEGFEIGFKIGIEKVKEEAKAEAVRNLITKLGCSDQQAAELAEVSLEFVIKVRSSLKKK